MVVNKYKMEASEWSEEKREARDSTVYWTESYKLRITEAILKYMEDNNISEEEIKNNVSFDWDKFLNFHQFSLENLAEVSMELGIDWKFSIIKVDED